MAYFKVVLLLIDNNVTLYVLDKVGVAPQHKRLFEALFDTYYLVFMVSINELHCHARLQSLLPDVVCL